MPPPKKFKPLSMASRPPSRAGVQESSIVMKFDSRDAGTVSNPIEVGDEDDSCGGIAQNLMTVKLEQKYKHAKKALAAYRTLNEALARKADEELLAKLDLEQRIEQANEEAEVYEQTIEDLEDTVADGLLREKALQSEIDEKAYELESLECDIAYFKEQLALAEGSLAQQVALLVW
ncbi:hypothetical protein JAAARDRAFT_187293 [Jaapia argillacea MUCL 33604]|uniref:Uncharacterized protein n=1 Tax=Jaapia argillacea MUCL 33604 TaxID=933084 RepID=A0A067QK45_9AGAM|nr:hypothetical protein JAAARDRAFT_187293 [Jaapia argillacea MUCL 33604]